MKHDIPDREFVVRTPLGCMRVWCEELSSEIDLPVIRVDYMHEDGNIPLAATSYDYSSNNIYTEIFGNIYEDEPTVRVPHRDINKVSIWRNT